MWRDLVVAWLVAGATIAPGLRGEPSAIAAARIRLGAADTLFAQGCLTAAASHYQDLVDLPGPEAAAIRGWAALGQARIAMARAREIEAVRGGAMSALQAARQVDDPELVQGLGTVFIQLARVERAWGGARALVPLRLAVEEIAADSSGTTLGAGFFERVGGAFEDSPRDQGRPSGDRVAVGPGDDLATVGALVPDAPGLAGVRLESVLRRLESEGLGAPDRARRLVQVHRLRREIVAAMRGHECEPVPARAPTPEPGERLPDPPATPGDPDPSWLH